MSEQITRVEAFTFAEGLWDELCCLLVAVMDDNNLNDDHTQYLMVDNLSRLAKGVNDVATFAINCTDNSTMQSLVDCKVLIQAICANIRKRYNINVVNDSMSGIYLRYANDISANIDLVQRYRPELSPRYPLPAWCGVEMPKSKLPDNKVLNMPLMLEKVDGIRHILINAIDKKLLEFDNNNKARWLGTKPQLALLLGILLCGDQFDEDGWHKTGNQLLSNYGEWFGVNNIGHNRSEANNVRGYNTILYCINHRKW